MSQEQNQEANEELARFMSEMSSLSPEPPKTKKTRATRKSPQEKAVGVKKPTTKKERFLSPAATPSVLLSPPTPVYNFSSVSLATSAPTGAIPTSVRAYLVLQTDQPLHVERIMASYEHSNLASVCIRGQDEHADRLRLAGDSTDSTVLVRLQPF